MTGNTGGGNNNISVAFDGTAAEAAKDSPQRAQQMQIKTADGKPLNEPPAVQSGAGEFYPVAGSTTKAGNTGDVPGGRPEGGPKRAQGGGASM